jgi:GNAT superfamily N-acetyltransferase
MIELKYLEWDSEILGVPSGIIDASDIPAARFEDVTSLILEKTEKNRELKFITIKLPERGIQTAECLIRKGASLINTELTFKYDSAYAEGHNYLSDKNLKLDFCKKTDATPFIPLAEQMMFSRFYLDPHIQQGKARKLWEESIRNHCGGLSDELSVAYLNNIPCGIIAVQKRQKRSVFMHIVGVLKEFQGKGIGRLMIEGITERYGKKYDLFVETQPENKKAKNLYIKSGFRIFDLKYILHYWR